MKFNRTAAPNRLLAPRGLGCALGCALALGSACTVDVNLILPGLGTGLGTGSTDDDHAGDDTGDPTTDGGEDTGSHTLLDLGDGDGYDELFCGVSDAELDAPLPCDRQTPSSVIDPVVAWTWTGPHGEDSVIVTPVVANLDDDNADGRVDLCDTPDIVVIAVDLPPNKTDLVPPGRIYVLDSKSGTTKLVINHPIDPSATPVLADLDGDGVPEIIAFERTVALEPGEIGPRRVVAFQADGALLWVSEATVYAEGAGALSVADLDGDGSPEILAPEHVLSAEGQLLWAPPNPPLANSVPIAVDLDLDGELEVLFGGSVYSSDGVLLFDLQLPGGMNTGVAAVANFDDDPYPEIYVQSSNHRILEHDGTLKLACGGGSGDPVAIQDIDGDGKAEILHAHANWFNVMAIVDDECVTVWSSKIDDLSASSSGTAFDFLADGGAESVYADLTSVRLFSEHGELLAQIPRLARSSTANPVVVDADNNGAANIIIVGSEPLGGDPLAGARASVIFIQNSDDRFAPTRRIWNQHAYYGTNIREDGRVPTDQAPHWLDANNFRANSAPSYVGALCQAPPIE